MGPSSTQGRKPRAIDICVHAHVRACAHECVGVKGSVRKASRVGLAIP